MFDSIKKIFSKEVKQEIGISPESLFREQKESVKKTCEICQFNKSCDSLKVNILCESIETQEDYDENKETILILDDNIGIISVLQDDLFALDEKGLIDINNYNIITFSSSEAVFRLQSTIKVYKGLNIKYAILDITIGGGLYTEERGNIILDGIDALDIIQHYNPTVKFLFFTGNKLNPYLLKNKERIDKFHRITGKDIFDFVVYKTVLTVEGRIEVLDKFLNTL